MLPRRSRQATDRLPTAVLVSNCWCTLASLKTTPREIYALLFSVVALAAALVGLRELPYSTSWIEAASEIEAGVTPTPGFQVGGLAWPISEYAIAPSLEPFRAQFLKYCEGSDGVEAALCASRELARHSPLGEPRHEFVDAQYDPAAVLQEHLDGAPGHCTTRSALVTVQLLAVGIPARVVQVLPTDGSGHNVLSVWDSKIGWSLVDPSVPGLVTRDGDAVAARELLDDATSITISPDVSVAGTAALINPAMTSAATVLFPEPWLYLRTGPRVARWPFRGSFARIGKAQLSLGPTQKIVALSALALLVTAGFTSVRLLLVLSARARANRSRAGA